MKIEKDGRIIEVVNAECLKTITWSCQNYPFYPKQWICGTLYFGDCPKIEKVAETQGKLL